MLNKGMDRRSFLTGAVATGAVAALSLAGCTPAAEKEEGGAPAEGENAAAPGADANGGYGVPTTETFEEYEYPRPQAGPVSFVAEPIAEADIIETREVEVLVIGAGIAGMCTAVSANENGLKCTVLEKGETVAFRGLDICAWGDKWHVADGTTSDPEELIKALMDLAEWRADYALLRKWADNCNPAIEWLADLVSDVAGEPYVSWKNGNAHMMKTNWYGTAVVFPKMMEGVVTGLKDIAEANGTEILFNTPAVQLVKEGDAVVGAIAETADGYVRFNASKGVVLATGGYENNPDRLNKYVRARDMCAGAGFMNATLTDTGDGHEMGIAVGALEDEYPHCLMTSTARYIGMPRVNSSGMRFAPEYISATLLINAIQNQIGGYDWIITDSNGAQQIEACRGDFTGATPSDELLDSFFAQAETADTLEELAQKMGVPEDIFVETVNRYNELCEKGVDEDFNCPATCLHAIKTPPFAAQLEKVAILTTVNGLRITPKSEVLSGETKRPIPGLYAVGNVSGGMFAGSYAHNVSGVSHSRCITFGWLLGKRLAGVIE